MFPTCTAVKHTNTNCTAAPIVSRLQAIADGSAPGTSKAAADKPKAAAAAAAADKPSKAATDKPKEDPKAKGAGKDPKAAAAAASKAMVQQKLEHQSPPKQQQAKRGKDTDRQKDASVLRGKAGDDKVVAELAEALELRAADKKKIDDVSLGLRGGWGWGGGGLMM
jgi:hypothetical protein